MSTTPATPVKSSLESANEAYAGRVANLEAAAERDADEREQSEKDSSLESVEAPLADEAKFVGNPEGLRKDVDSEEKFAEGQEDGEEDLGLPEASTQKAPAKKAAAKK